MILTAKERRKIRRQNRQERDKEESEKVRLGLKAPPEPKGKMSHMIRKPAFCICENKGADQLGSNSIADYRLCFSYIHSTIPLLSKSEFSSL